MAITNPTKYVTVRRLERYKQKLADVFASQEDVEALADIIGVDTQYEFVDLGLPSGTLWAKCNVGATVESDYGNYYMYGKGATPYNKADSRYEGTENPLDPSKDTATQVMGAMWHTPTGAEFDELYENTQSSIIADYNGTGKRVVKFVAANGNYIVFPYGGYYDGGSYNRYIGDVAMFWTCEPKNADKYYAMANFVNTQSTTIWGQYHYRYYGLNIRGVISKSVLGPIGEKADKADTYTKAQVDAKTAVMTGAGASAAGAQGLVPAPAAGDNVKFLRGDGTWSDDLPRAAFVDTTLVFYSGGAFSGTTLVIG